jgi:hypothetical protein
MYRASIVVLQIPLLNGSLPIREKGKRKMGWGFVSVCSNALTLTLTLTLICHETATLHLVVRLGDIALHSQPTSHCIIPFLETKNRVSLRTAWFSLSWCTVCVTRVWGFGGWFGRKLYANYS